MTSTDAYFAERDRVKRDRVAEAFYETYAQEMRSQGEAVTAKWPTLPTAQMRAWVAVVQLADDRGAVSVRAAEARRG